MLRIRKIKEMAASYQNTPIPRDLAHRLQQVFHLDAAPRTLDDLLPASMNLGLL
jgi:hypothetical protein